MNKSDKVKKVISTIVMAIIIVLSINVISQAKKYSLPAL